MRPIFQRFATARDIICRPSDVEARPQPGARLQPQPAVRRARVPRPDRGFGAVYARLYTHLFFEGTILSSKKEEYDPAAAEDAVRALMQKLHKAMIRELTRGEHDPRITAFFGARGEPAMLEPRPVAAAAAPAAAASEPGGRRAPCRCPPRARRCRRSREAAGQTGGDRSTDGAEAFADRGVQPCRGRRGPPERRDRRRRRAAAGPGDGGVGDGRRQRARQGRRAR